MYFAYRVATDADNIALLHQWVGFTAADQGLGLITTFCGRPITAEIQSSVVEVVATMGPGPDASP